MEKNSRLSVSLWNSPLYKQCNSNFHVVALFAPSSFHAADAGIEHRGFKLQIHQIEPFWDRPTWKVHSFVFVWWYNKNKTCFWSVIEKHIYLHEDNLLSLLYTSYFKVLPISFQEQVLFLLCLQQQKSSALLKISFHIFLLHWFDFIPTIRFPLCQQNACSMPTACTLHRVFRVNFYVVEVP